MLEVLFNSKKITFALSEIKKKLEVEIVSLSNATSDLVVEGMVDIRYPEQNKIILLTDLTKILKNRQSSDNEKSIRYLKALNSGNIFLVGGAGFDLATTLEWIKENNSKNSSVDDFEEQGKVFILSHSVKLDFISLLKIFNPYDKLPLATPLMPNSDSIDYCVGPYCVTGEAVKIGKGTILSAQIYLGHNVTIGERVTIHPNVTIHSGTVIKDSVIIHSGTVIGGDGFGYEIDFKKKTRIKIPQIGNVVIHENVEIGSNCTIDRATIGSTIINRRVKIDNLVQIAHNVEVGEDAVIVSQVGIAGSSRLGKGTILGGQVGVSDHVKIGDGAQVGAQSGVMPHTVIPAGGYYFGSPVMPYRERIKMELSLKKLIEKH